MRRSGRIGAVVLPPSLDLDPKVLALRPMALWQAMRRQPVSVWAVYAYLFFEYVRPQTIYPWLDVLPFARLSLITAAVAALLEASARRKWTVLDTGIVAYTVVVFLSLGTAFDAAYGFSKLDLYLSWVLVYLAISTAVNTQTRVVLMLLGWLLWNLKMSQHAFRSWASIGFGFRDWGVGGAPGWFQNSGEFGIQMCVVLPISLYFALGLRKHVSRPVFLALLVLPFTAVSGAIASSSRGALVGVAAVALWMLVRSRYKVRGTIALFATALAVWAFTPEEQKVRFDTAGDDRTSESRLTYWKRGLDIANEFPLLGVGYSGWMPYYTHKWGSRLGENEGLQLSHNLFIQNMSELGYVGLVALLFLMGGTFWLNAKTRALARRLGEKGYLSEQLGWGFDGALVGYATSGFFVTVLYYPYLWVNLAMTAALHLSVARASRAMQLPNGQRPA